MSETEQEPDVALEEPEPEPEPEPTPDETHERIESPQDNPDTQLGQSLDAQRAAQDEAEAAINKKATNYWKALQEITKDTWVPFVPCELCADGYPGLRHAEPRTDSAASAVNAFHGTLELDSLKQAEWAIRCTGCEGRGWVKTSSLVQGNEAIVCRKCNGSGYNVLDQDSGIVKAPESVNGDVVGPAQVGVNPDDPRIQALNAEGFMVVKVPTIAGQ